MVIRPFGVLRLSVGVTHSRIFTGQKMKLEPWLGGRNIQLFFRKVPELARVFGIRRETIWRWISTFAEGSQPVGKPKGVCSRAKEYSNLNPKPMPQKTASRLETPEEELARLRRENAELQEALKMAEWSNHAKDVMIDLAEKTFNIPIRKKSGAKQ